MTSRSLEYCLRAIIRHINGDTEYFEKYRDIAVEEYEKVTTIARLGELIPDRTKEKLYRMVS